MRGLEQLTPDNHTLYRRVQHLVALNWSWEAIADDVGIYQVNDLCEWVLAYREPKKMPMVRASYVNTIPVKPAGVSVKTAQFMNWRRAREGAQATLRAMRP